jgi:hypothetical protein
MAFFFVRLGNSEPQVVLAAPRLGSGQAELQALLDQEVQANEGAIQAIVNDAVKKPLFLRGSADSVAVAALLPSLPLIAKRRYVSMSVGGYATLRSDSYELATLQDRLDNFRMKDDFAMGAALHPLALQANISLEKLVRGLSLQGAFGLMSLRYKGFDFSSFLVQGGLAWQFFAPAGKSRFLRWEGLCLAAGLAWSANSFGTRVSPGLIRRSFSFDLDGGGPLLPIPLSVSLDPSFDIKLESSALAAPIQVSTGIRALGSLSFQAGCGVYPIWATSAIRLDSVAGTTELELDSYLSGLMEQNGSISVSGTTDPLAARPFGGFISAAFGLEAGGCGIRLPLLWDFGSGLSAGLIVGVAI